MTVKDKRLQEIIDAVESSMAHALQYQSFLNEEIKAIVEELQDWRRGRT